MEIWKDIKGYENMYQVSTHGNVKSVDRVIEVGNTIRNNKGRLMAFTCDKDGYFQLHLSKNGVSKLCKVHRLVAETFLDNPDNKPLPNHINGLKQINHYKNLEWATYSENTLHAYKIGSYKGIGNKPKRVNYKFSDEQIGDIRKMKSDGFSQHSIAKKYGLQQSIISRIINNKSYTHI